MYYINTSGYPFILIPAIRHAGWQVWTNVEHGRMLF